MKKQLKRFGCGILIGLSNLIPGFSGGTMALILGILEEFTEAVSSFTKTPFKAIKELWALVFGMGIGIIVATFTVVICLNKWPIITASFFVGLVLASIPLVFRETNYEKPKTKDLICFCICFIISLVLPFLKKLGIEINITNPDFLVIVYIFIVAAIAASTMMIPAASGSLIMLAFGIFASILTVLKDTLTSLLDLNLQGFFAHFDVLIPFMLGCLVGVIVISKVMSYAFKKHKNMIWYGILGLLVTSLFTIYYDAYESHLISNPSLFTNNLVLNIVLSIVALLVAFFGLRMIIKYSDALTKEKNNNTNATDEELVA